MNENEIRARMEKLIDRWIQASPAEKVILVHEKIRLEDMLAQVRAEGTAV